MSLRNVLAAVILRASSPKPAEPRHESPPSVISPAHRAALVEIGRQAIDALIARRRAKI